MNGYIRAIFAVPLAFIKFSVLRLFHPHGLLDVQGLNRISPGTELSMDKSAVLKIGKGFNMRGGAKLRVRKDAVCEIGKNVSLSNGAMIVCREHISIGDNVQISPNVLIYDHDHDFREGMQYEKYKTSPVKIGNNVWIGGNTVILRGTIIGDNCVIGAGSVIKGKYSANSVIIQKRETEVINYKG